jgi:adenine-specific DNA-methyltransferase
VSANYKKLRVLLQELFQLDQADLDFGIYRIMNQKRDEIVRFLDDDLLPQVKEAFGHYQSADRAEIQKELDKLVQNITNAGMNPDDSPKVKELKEKLSENAVDVTALENEVFSHLFNFFRRYYSEGDFISQRRYKEGVYAIPYEGEEVKLHWANADQYYVKSSEYFRDYVFTMPSGKRVRVHLVAATTEQNNKKEAAGKARRFVLCSDDPIYEENGELFIRFEYRLDDGKKKQDVLNREAIDRVLASVGFGDWIQELRKSAPTETNPTRTVLERHLTQYTARNTMDYFIHKDLGGFLRRELDFFVKNEVMHLDDIEHESAPKVEQYLSQIKVIRKISEKLIQFLEQLENFQKKLWLKKKFVVETNYCITLDRVPEELYPEIVANDAQREEWVRLFCIDQIKKNLNTPGYSKPLKIEFLKSNKHLLVDTAFFPPAFKDKLLASFEDYEQTVSGVLIDGDNFQALRVLSPRYRSGIQAICVDPPYNTGDDGFAYKDQYQHSSWLAMMADRFQEASHLLKQDGVTFANIDDNEYRHLWFVLASVFGIENYLGSMVWKRRSASAMSSQPLSLDHEYVLAFGADSHQTQLFGLSKSIDDYPIIDEATGRHYASTDLTIGMTKEQRPNQFYPIKNPRTGKVFSANPNRVWRFFPETMQQVIADDLVIWPDEVDGNLERPRYKTYFDPEGMKAKPCSSWIETANSNDREISEDESEYQIAILQSGLNSEGGRVVDRIFGERAFAYPKPLSLLRSLVRASTRGCHAVLDFFAGSGTTGHAVIEMNREDAGDRRYLLVEVGEYFASILKPRIQKVIYSREWKDGMPVKRDGVSHAFKYIRLESYEDALNNLELKKTKQQEKVLFDDTEVREQFVLSYMLDVESRGSQSLLNVEGFRNPDQYKLNVERNGETQLVDVDLVETFNWLLGLTVKHIDLIRGIRVVEGTNPYGERVLVLWRNLDEIGNEKLDDWFEKQGYSTRDLEYDLVYVNGDNNLENLRRNDQTWKVRLIEDEFQRLMFDVQDV